MTSKKIRFEVFKRDGFICQYCGRTPPEVVLEVDHVIPKAHDGKDDINNYLTACFDCNRGKGKNELADIPSGLKSNLSTLKEKREQIGAYNEFLNELSEIREHNMSAMEETFTSYYSDYLLSDNFKTNTLARFLNQLPPERIDYAMKMACSKFDYMKNKDYASTLSLKYFCGICWNWIKKPETRDW